MTYKIAPGTSHIYIQDQQGNYVAKSMDSSRENFHRIERLIEAANSVAGIPDPAAALKAAREALEECASDQCAVTKYDGIGNESHDDAPVTGCDCWACERTRRVRAALAAIKGEQP